MDLTPWGEGARLICRRERPHPGAQLSMFDFSEGFRHRCFITNAPKNEGDAPALELGHRGHARVEDRVPNWKDCGLANLPFASFTQNLAWVALSLVAGSLLAWAQMTCRTVSQKRPSRRRSATGSCTSPRCSCDTGGSSCSACTRPGPWSPALQRAFLKLRSTFP